MNFVTLQRSVLRIKMWICIFVVASFVSSVDVTTFKIPVPVNGPNAGLKNYAKFFKHFHDKKLRQISTLRVLSHHYAPFMYQNGNKSFYNGIEFELIRTIAEKEHLNLSITETAGRHSPENLKQLLFKCV